MVWSLMAAMERFAPNGIVRRKVQQIDKKYREIIGEPTPIMKSLSKIVVKLATQEYKGQLNNPSHYRPKTEPFKRYIYNKSDSVNSDIPYQTEWPTNRTFKVWKDMSFENIRYIMLEQMMRVKRAAQPKKSDPIIDNYLLGMIDRHAFGFGL